MVAIKANQANSLLSRPDGKLRAFLLYGPDAGLVSERAEMLARKLADRDKPAGEVLRLDDADLEGDPDRLATELLTVPMFGGAKVVRASTGRRINVTALQPLIEGGGLAGWLIVEAGNVRPDDKIRVLFEKSANAAAIPCYPDEGASLEGLVDEMLKEARRDICPDARQELLARLGADRVLSRAEVDKLILYTHGKARIEADDVEAIVGDASELAVDTIISAAATGDTAAALSASDRALASGESGQSIMLAAERHFQRLHKCRAAVDAGRSVDEVLRASRPPLPPKVRYAMERQCRVWSVPLATAALIRIQDAVRGSRTTAADEVALAERLLMEIARLARSGASGARGR